MHSERASSAAAIERGDSSGLSDQLRRGRRTVTSLLGPCSGACTESCLGRQQESRRIASQADSSYSGSRRDTHLCEQRRTAHPVLVLTLKNVAALQRRRHSSAARTSGHGVRLRPVRRKPDAREDRCNALHTARSVLSIVWGSVDFAVSLLTSPFGRDWIRCGSRSRAATSSST